MRAGSRGFTYLALLWWVAISGVLLAALGQQWRLESRRQREAELLFRAGQIQAALASYRDRDPTGAGQLPERIEDLLEDRRGPEMRRHLRQWWPDPVTGQPWGLLTTDGRIRGVFSTSLATPIKPPEGVLRYSEWHFEAPTAAPVRAASAASDSP